MKFKFLLILSCFFIPYFAFGQKERSLIRKGNKKFETAKFYDAEIDYRKALESKPLMDEGNYNLGNSLYKQEKYEEASAEYNSVGEHTSDNGFKESSYYNLGNAMYKAQKYNEAVNAYKNALRMNPSNEDARYNLTMAQRMLKQNSGGGGQQDQQNNENQQNQQGQQNQQDQQNQQQSQQEQQQNQQNEQQDQQQAQNSENQEGDQQQGQQMTISKADAERMLEALKNDEQKTLLKIQESKNRSQRVKIDKDW